MQYKDIKVDSFLKKITNKDTLFAGDYIVDPYQNCEFGCLYCDSSFDKTIFIKKNAPEILREELKKHDKGMIIVGSVHDPYQKSEKNCKITRKLLEIISESGFSCHILTKSDLVLRDIDILSKINNCIVTISITSMDSSVSNIFEGNAPTPKKRLGVMEELVDNNIRSGLSVMPVFPFIVDEELEKIAKYAKEYKAQYFLHKHLELKGDQKQIFFDLLSKNYPNFVEKYEKLYKDNYMPNDTYVSKLNKTMAELCRTHNLENKIIIY